MKFYNCFFFFYFFLFFPFSFYKKIFYLQPVQVFALVQVSKNKMFLERKSRNISVKSFVTNRNTIFSLFTYTKYKYMILAIFFEKKKKKKKQKKCNEYYRNRLPLQRFKYQFNDTSEIIFHWYLSRNTRSKFIRESEREKTKKFHLYIFFLPLFSPHKIKEEFRSIQRKKFSTIFLQIFHFSITRNMRKIWIKMYTIWWIIWNTECLNYAEIFKIFEEI